MGWSMGGVEERYLKYAGAGDEAVGRKSNLPDPLSDEFAVSPPYFDLSTIQNEAEQDRKKQEIKKFVEVRLSKFQSQNQFIWHTFYLLVYVTITNS